MGLEALSTQIIQSFSQLSNLDTNLALTLAPREYREGLGSSGSTYLLLEVLNLTLQPLTRLLQLRDLDFGCLHAIPVKLCRHLKLLVLRGTEVTPLVERTFTFDFKTMRNIVSLVLCLLSSSLGMQVKH